MLFVGVIGCAALDRSQQQTPPSEQAAAPTQSSAAEQRGTDAAPFVVQGKPTEKQASDDKAQRQDEAWYRRANLFVTGILVLLTLATGVAVAYQGYYTRLAAEATRDSILTTERHFKLVNQQWLTVGSWGLVRLPTISSVIGAMIRPDAQSTTVAVGFAITNKTPMGLTITGIHTDFQSTGQGISGPPDGFHDQVIPPTHSMPVITRHMELTPNEIEAFNGDGLYVSVHGWVEFMDAMEDRRIQPFSIMGVIGAKKEKFYESNHAVPGTPLPGRSNRQQHDSGQQQQNKG